MTLPNDITRCHDASCFARNSCLRWLMRTSGDNQTPHAQTLIDENGLCRSILDIERVYNYNRSKLDRRLKAS